MGAGQKRTITLVKTTQALPVDDVEFDLKKIAVSAYGPSLLFGIGDGAILPIIALTARHLGASVAEASLILALIGIFSLISNIPAAMAATRYGERAALVGASVISFCSLLICIFAPNYWLLAVGVSGIGVAAAVFSLARQSYMIEAVPLHMRARALSLLGGSTRVGLFIGPFVGAGAIHLAGMVGAYCAALVAVTAAGVLSYLVPDLTHHASAAGARARPGVMEVMRDHWRVFLTLGLGVVMVSAMRASRQVVIPLWADHLGLQPATSSLIYGCVAAVDMLTCYPAGVAMDRYGRFWVALPSTLIMGLAFIGISGSSGVLFFVLASLLLGFGNGIGSGIIMTMGADAAPSENRNVFLGIWRVLSDTGTCLGPVLLSVMAAVATLGAGVAATGVLGLLGAAVFWSWLPRSPGRANALCNQQSRR
jgi:MFS family permease